MRRKHVAAGVSSHSAAHKTAKPRRWRRQGLTMLLASLALFGAKTQAQPLAEKDDKAQREAWTKYYVQQLPKYRFYTGSNLNLPLEVISEAKLRWGNPVRVGRTHGELFVWTNEGRGAVVGNILSYDFGDDQRRVAHEFHSFDTEDLLCKYAGGADFKISGPGVDYVPIPGAPKPAKSRVLRLAQMRKLSKYFAASTRPSGISRPLRPLNQPLYRFETERIDDDGAIFAYVTGTDPEVLVAIVTRPTSDGPKWHFGAGRFTDLPIDLKFKDKTVWEYDQRGNYKAGYYALHGIDFQPFMPNIRTGETK